MSLRYTGLSGATLSSSERCGGLLPKDAASQLPPVIQAPLPRFATQPVMDTIKGCVAKRGKGAWITGGSWDAASFGKSPPHRSLLDKVAPDNPVYLNDISGHSALVNT